MTAIRCSHPTGCLVLTLANESEREQENDRNYFRSYRQAGMGRSFFRDATFALQTNRKSFHVVRFLNRLEANLRDAIVRFFERFYFLADSSQSSPISSN